MTVETNGANGNGHYGYAIAKDKRHHITLVEAEHTSKLSQITRAMWETLAELQAEHDLIVNFLKDTTVSPSLPANQMREYEMKTKFWQDWMDRLFINSNSVEGWKSNSMVTALTHAQEIKDPNPAGKVTVTNGKAEGVKRGIWD